MSKFRKEKPAQEPQAKKGEQLLFSECGTSFLLAGLFSPAQQSSEMLLQSVFLLMSGTQQG